MIPGTYGRQSCRAWQDGCVSLIGPSSADGGERTSPVQGEQVLDWGRGRGCGTRGTPPASWWSAEPNLFVAQETADLPPGRALDLAAGEGATRSGLARRGGR